MKPCLWIPIALLLCGGTARADQCAWIDDGVANKARAVLLSSRTFSELCEPCGDNAPGAPQIAKTVELRAAGDSYRELWVNGTAIDLAYVFVKTDDTHFKNLAALAGCPATGVSTSLDIADETPHGVLITAGNAPLPEPPPTPAIAPPPPPVVALPQVFVYTTTTREVAWLPIVLGATGGLITGSAFTILLLGVRRRRTMRPRATDLAARND